MNKKILVGALAMTCAGLAQAQSNVTLYGILDASLEGFKSPNGNVSQEVSGLWSGSRWGIRGVEDLGDGLKANFFLESGVLADTGASDQGGLLFGRRATVGLSSATLGAVDIGRRDGPFYEFISQFEPVPDAGGFGLMNDLSNKARGYTRRYSNMFSYETPLFSGFKARAMYALGENNTVAGSDKKNGNTLALYASYTNGPLVVGYSYNGDKNISNVSTGLPAGAPVAGTPTGTVTRKYNAFGGSYDFSVVKLFATYYTDKRANFFATPASALTPAINQNVYWIGASAPFGASNIAFDYGKVKDKSTDFNAAHPGAQNVRQWALTYWYNLSKRTNLYAGYSAVRNDNFTGISSSITAYANGLVDTTQVSTASNNVIANSKAYSLGIRHKF